MESKGMPNNRLAAKGNKGETHLFRVLDSNKTVTNNRKDGEVRICVREKCFDSVHRRREAKKPESKICNIEGREV